MPDKPEQLQRPKRFYTSATTGPADRGFAVMLDGRVPKTPGGARLVAPTAALAQLMAAEWQAQDPFVQPETMPATRLANAAIDGVSQARNETAAEIARYAGSDLLCYFAEAPQGLVEEEAARWGPLLAWAAEDLGVELHRVTGIIHQPQDPAALARVEALALESDDFGLAGLAHGVGLFGSAILSLALQRGRLDGEQAFEISRLDEAFQERMWGVDAEAAERAERLRAEAIVLDRWFKALR